MSTSNRKKVLYLDDEPFLCEIFLHELKGMGFDPAVFTEPTPAIEYFEKHQHQLLALFIDFRLKGVTGEDVLKKIETKVPCYLVTGDLAFLNRIDTSRLKEVIPKPVDFDRVTSILRSLES